MHRLQIVFGLIAALLAGVAVAGPWAAPLHGLSGDTLVWLRLAVLGPRYAPDSSAEQNPKLDEMVGYAISYYET